MDALLQDVRYAVRTLARRPGFTLAAVLSLAIGVAATSAVFGVVNGILFKPVPGVQRTDRLVQLSDYSGGDWADLTYPAVQRFGEETALVEGVSAFALASASVATEGEPEVRGGLAITANYLELLGVRPALGRAFAAAQEATFPSVAPLVLITDHLWRSAFGGRLDIVGRSVRVNGVPLEVIGVLPSGFAGHATGLLVDVFLPLGLNVPGFPSAASLSDAQSTSVESLARLQAGVAPAVAANVFSRVADRTARAAGRSGGRGAVIRVEPWGPLPSAVRGAASAFVAVLTVLVGLALLMACTNVTSMLLARATERGREFAIRRALGAASIRLTRQLVTEAVLLFATAGAMGIALAAWITSLTRAIGPRLPIPGRIAFDFGLDWRVLLLSSAVTLAAGVLAGLVPGLHARGARLAQALRDAAAAAPSRGSLRLRRGLVGLQLGVTTVLLVAGGLFGNGLRQMRLLDTGWRTDGVMTMDLDLELRGMPAEEGRVFQSALVEQVGRVPGVTHAAIAAKLPLAGCSSLGTVTVPGREGAAGATGASPCFNRVSPGYFAALGIAVRAGRDFGPRDDASAPRVAAINETMARRLFPAGGAVGQHVQVGTGAFASTMEVIAVVADAKYRSLSEAPTSFYYIPMAQRYNASMVLHVRSSGTDPTVMAAALRSAVRAADPWLPIPSPRTLADALSVHFLPQRLAAWGAAMLGIFALLLAAVGVYGVTAFVVAGRAREIGIRLALGATPRNVVGLVLRQGSRAPVIGVAVGLILGWVFSRVTSSVLAGISSTDPVAFGLMPALIVTVAVVATMIPVWRLLRADPLASIRTE